ncbi:divalent-cation tolerance protein CutA [Thermodesulfobacteriota bacterium]
MKVNLVYMTAGSMEEAQKIGKEIVSQRLAACVNIIDNMNSFYWWEGELQDDREVIIIAKTREVLVPELIRRVKSLHSYDCPCVVSIPLVDGNPGFLNWIADETAPGKKRGL